MRYLSKIIFFAFILAASWLKGEQAKIIGNITDDTYASIILSPSIYSKLVDVKTESNSRRGAFEFTIRVDYPCFYRLYYKEKRISIYVEPNKLIQLSIDNNKATEYVNFYGDLALENSFLNQGKIPMIGTGEQRERFKSLAKTGHEPYKSAVEEEVRNQTNAFNEEAKKLKLKDAFVDLYQKNNIAMAGMLYQYYYCKFAYSNPDSFIAQNPEFLSVFASLPDVSGYEGSLLYFENQLNALKSKVCFLFRDKFLAGNVDDLELYKAYYASASKIQDNFIRLMLQENILGEWVSYYGRSSDMQTEISGFISSLTPGDHKNDVVKKIEHLTAYEAGKPAPIFSFEDNAGNVRNLKEFTGKIVYISVWASWSEACIDELSHEQKLFDQYKSNPDIQFLHISIDEKKENWEKALRKYTLNNGMHGISFPGGFNSDIAKKYGIQTVPQYVIIDKSGNLVNAKAPKPSQAERLFSFLDKLISSSK